MWLEKFLLSGSEYLRREVCGGVSILYSLPLYIFTFGVRETWKNVTAYSFRPLLTFLLLFVFL